jgi:uncharacterized protein YdcH (DUF465 family)
MASLQERLNYYLKAEAIPDGQHILEPKAAPTPKAPPNNIKLVDHIAALRAYAKAHDTLPAGGPEPEPIDTSRIDWPKAEASDAKPKLYLGLNAKKNSREIFSHDKTPTHESHGHKYNAVIGPFKTRRGAEFMRDYGRNNPHVRNVEDAERIAKIYVTPKAIATAATAASITSEKKAEILRQLAIMQDIIKNIKNDTTSTFKTLHDEYQKLGDDIKNTAKQTTATTIEVATTREQQRMRSHIRSLLHNTSMHRRNHDIDIKKITLGPEEGGDRSLHLHLHSHGALYETAGGHHHHYELHVQEYGKHKPIGKDRSNSELIQTERSMLRSHLMHKLYNTSILTGRHPEHITRVRRGSSRRVVHVYTTHHHYIVHIRHSKTGI